MSITASLAQLIAVRRVKARLAMTRLDCGTERGCLRQACPRVASWGCVLSGARCLTQDNGLKLSNRWKGKVYVNPPFTTYGQWQFVNRAIDEVENGKVGSAPPLLPPGPCARSCASCEGGGGAGPR